MHGDTTRPLLPEMLALIQSCVCQEGETLARMGLTVLQEFITGLEEREASYLQQQQQQQQQQQCKQRVIVRPAAAGAGAGDAFTVWDCLTASLTAMLLDNLPVEVLEGSETAATTADAAAIGSGSGSGRQLSAAELSPQLSPVAPASLRAAYTSSDGAALAAAATAARSVTEGSTFDSSSGSTTTDDI
eukprot:1526-Heterococcus_DN1.PRE.1